MLSQGRRPPAGRSSPSAVVTFSPSAPPETLVSSAAVTTRKELDRAAATRRSALWAAWGDALGFPTELVRDSSDVERRLGTARVETTVRWPRRVGGRLGVTVELPAGMYSDDTQLRLAVSRSIRGPQRFDIEVFSKIELPVFLSYGFGIGRGTRAAAQSLTKRSIRWYSNFFDSRAKYLDGGGNGAAMRIQPHVWAAPKLDPKLFLANVIRDAVTTHGHVRGILGAAMHAEALAIALADGSPPEPSRWQELARSLESVSEVIAADEMLRERWLPVWERGSRQPLADAVSAGIDELLLLIKMSIEATSGNGPVDARYAQLADAMGGLTAKTRGSATITTVLALWLAHYGTVDAAGAIRVAANLIGSDTDTIASMAGALIGPSAPEDLPGPLVDEEMIASEAERLAVLASGGTAPSFAHPDPLGWQAPRTQADALGLLDGRLVLAGLGPATEKSDPIVAADGASWQWLELEAGQTVFVKRRAELPRLAPYAAPQPRLVSIDGGVESAAVPVQEQLPATTKEASASPSAPISESAVPRATRTRGPTTESARYPDSVEEGVALVVKSRFEFILIARLLMHYARQEDGTVKAAVFAAGVADAIRGQDRLNQPSSS